MYSALVIAALNFSGPPVSLPAPAKKADGSVLVPLELLKPLPVPPIPHSTDAYPGEVPVPFAPRPGVDRQVDFPDRAILIIQLPPDADLYVNTFHIRSFTNRRAFLTVELPEGKAYYYDLKVRVVREFRPFFQFQRVVFRPGEVAVVSFGDVACGLPFETGWH
jgi:uncharacterized protein (TIGR03000 family)